MEPLLHEPLRKKAIARQVALGLGNGNGKDSICEAILYYLDYPKRYKLGGRQEKRLLICYNREKR